MKTAQWTVAAILAALLVVPMTGTAATQRVLNGDCEEAGDSMFRIPHWVNDWDDRSSARVDRVGPDNNAACAITGNGMLRSQTPFVVTGGEVFTVSADIWEMRDDNDGHSGVGRQTAGDSVIVLEFLFVGASPVAISFHCDQYVDLLDNGVNDGSDSCTAADQYIPFQSATVTCKAPVLPTCRKYQDPVVVPPSAVYGRILLANSIHTQNLDPLTGTKLASPTEITLFDNIRVI